MPTSISKARFFKCCEYVSFIHRITKLLNESLLLRRITPARYVHGPGQDVSTGVNKSIRTSLVPSTEHQWHQLSEIPAQSPEILKDNTPSHSVFTLLPSDNRYTSICCRTTRLHSSFTPQAVSLLNSSSSRNSTNIVVYFFFTYVA